MNYLVVCQSTPDKRNMIQQVFLALMMYGDPGWKVNKGSYTIFNPTTNSRIDFKTITQMSWLDNVVYHDIYRSFLYNQTETFEVKQTYDTYIRRTRKHYGKPNRFLEKLMKRMKSGDASFNSFGKKVQF
ncbi:hypothetical protein BAU18_000558 [Enterococcus diestrammenae]|uniref:Uncharacterized protein n=1 Tax=Enterococcus diestrammenae TaxID=1155073 RepID=A0ABV0EYU3_9ENTE|nr:hypothetical protein BAU18_03525 [Enterococcus diestrammenae]